jgi:hypothetical protein
MQTQQPNCEQQKRKTGQDRTVFAMESNLLSKIDKEKYTTTKSKLIPHALWTEPLGSGAHDPNILCIIPSFLLAVG